MSKRLLEVFQALRFQLILQQLWVSGIISQQAVGHVRFQQGSKDRQKMLRGTRGTLGEGVLSCARLGGRLGWCGMTSVTFRRVEPVDLYKLGYNVR